jgi:hypothetical protein
MKWPAVRNRWRCRFFADEKRLSDTLMADLLQQGQGHRSLLGYSPLLFAAQKRALRQVLFSTLLGRLFPDYVTFVPRTRPIITSVRYSDVFACRHGVAYLHFARTDNFKNNFSLSACVAYRSLGYICPAATLLTSEKL